MCYSYDLEDTKKKQSFMSRKQNVTHHKVTSQLAGSMEMTGQQVFAANQKLKMFAKTCLHSSKLQDSGP